MILKFDHISYSCKLDDKHAALIEGYTQDFCEKGLPNIEAKAPFLENQDAIHDIALYHCDEKYPIEITAYPNCTGVNKKYDMNDAFITVYSEAISETITFYETLGFKKIQVEGEDDSSADGVRLELIPFMESKKVVLLVKSAIVGTVCLDQSGFGSLAFVVDKVERHQKQLEKQGYFVSGVDTLTVNGKLLKICFASNEAGDIVELIGVR